MWDHWNPIKDISTAWTDTRSIWGKLKVVLFYTFIWFMIFSNMYQVFVPVSMGMECVMQEINDDVATRAWFYMMIRIASFYIFAWSLMIERQGTTLPNMRFMVGALLVGSLVSLWEKNKVNADCYRAFVNTWPIYILWPVLALTSAYVERRVDGRETTPESEPLVA